MNLTAPEKPAEVTYSGIIALVKVQGSEAQRTHLLEGGEVEPHTAESYTLFPVQSQRVSPIQDEESGKELHLVAKLVCRTTARKTTEITIRSIAPRHWCKGSRESGKAESWT